MRHLFAKIFFSCCILVFLPAVLWPDDVVLRKSTIDWARGILNLSFRIDFAEKNTSVLKGRQTSEVRVKELLPFALQEALAPVYIDSFTLVADIIKTDADMLLAMEQLAADSAPIRSYLSPRLDYYTSEYAFKLYPDIVSLLPIHEIPRSMPGILDWEATSEYTGVVIYLKGDFPVRGTREKGPLMPSFFPKIFDENMSLVFSMEMTDPDVLLEWGMCSYADSVNAGKNNPRVGHSPFTTMGTAIFGKYQTDIIISENAARKLLYTDHNRELLKAGKILIICDLPDDQ